MTISALFILSALKKKVPEPGILLGPSQGYSNCLMTTENDRIIVKRDIFNGQGDLTMHEQAMREDELVYDASRYKHCRRMTQRATLLPVT